MSRNVVCMCCLIAASLMSTTVLVQGQQDDHSHASKISRIRDVSALNTIERTVQQLKLSSRLVVTTAIVRAAADDGTTWTWTRQGSTTRLALSGSEGSSTKIDVQPLPKFNGTMSEEGQQEHDRNPELRFIPAISFATLIEMLNRPEFSLIALPDASVDGHTEKVILACRSGLPSAQNPQCMTWYIDIETSLPYRVAYHKPASGAINRFVDVDATFGEIKTENGFSFPTEITTRTFGGNERHFHVLSAEINPSL